MVITVSVTCYYRNSYCSQTLALEAEFSNEEARNKCLQISFSSVRPGLGLCGGWNTNRRTGSVQWLGGNFPVQKNLSLFSGLPCASGINTARVGV